MAYDIKVLKTDVAELKTDVQGLKREVKSIKETQAEHSEMLVFIVQKMNTMTEDNRRWFEMAQENHRDEMRAWRDASQIDRERLDDRENRIGRLEAC